MYVYESSGFTVEFLIARNFVIKILPVLDFQPRISTTDYWTSEQLNLNTEQTEKMLYERKHCG